MLVMAMAVPICLQSLADGSDEMSRSAAVDLAEEISDEISRISFCPIGESSELSIGEKLGTLSADCEIHIGDIFGRDGFPFIKCGDRSGWSAVITIELSDEIDGVCSPERLPVVLTSLFGSIRLYHSGSQFDDIILLEPA